MPARARPEASRGPRPSGTSDKTSRDSPSGGVTTLGELGRRTLHTLSAVADFPFAAFNKGLEFMAGFGRQMSRREREARRPAEHRPAGAAPAPDAGQKKD